MYVCMESTVAPGMRDPEWPYLKVEGEEETGRREQGGRGAERRNKRRREVYVGI